MPAKTKAKVSKSSTGGPTAATKRKAAPKAAAKPPVRASSNDWRPQAIDQVRRLIRAADPEAVEEVKWRKASNAMQGVATWSHDGLICTGETYKDKVKFTFARGASLPDPTGLFNADDKGATRRAIDVYEGKAVDPLAFKALVKAAVAANQSAKKS